MNNLNNSIWQDRITTGLRHFIFSLLLILGFVINGYAQLINQEITSTKFSIDSKILNEKCKVFVSLPEGYDSTEQEYPVIYVLDGEYYFNITTEISALLNQNVLSPNCIIVGITTNNRQRDFSPPVENTENTKTDSITGGADKFLLYIKSELLPAIESKYRTNSNNILIGHSLGGLLAYYSLYKAPGLFQSIISIDGSTWWNEGKIGKALIQYFEQHPNYKGQIFECRKDITIPVRFPPNVELLDYLKNKRPRELIYTYLELPDETHGTIALPGIYYGLKGIFANYKKYKQDSNDLEIKSNEKWMNYFNSRINQIDSLYLPDALIITANGATFKTTQERKQYYTKLKKSIDEIKTISTKYFTQINSELSYEIGSFVTSSNKIMKYLIIWRNVNNVLLREVELISEMKNEISDIAGIDTARFNWMDWCNSHLVAKLVSNLYFDNAVYYNNHRVIVGKDAITKEYDYMNNPNYHLTLTPIVTEAVCDSLVYEIGQCSGSYTDKYILIWGKRNGSPWKVLFDSNL